jgi:hypothetical protein
MFTFEHSPKHVSAPAATSAAAVVFVDIDGTLTHSNGDAPPAPRGRVPSNPLAGILMERGLAFDEAQERARRAELESAPTPGGVWPFGADRRAGIPEGHLSAYITDVFARRYALHPDAVRFLRGLRALPAVRVYPATTNGAIFVNSLDVALSAIEQESAL